MGTFSLTRQNRLYWLGRYTERVVTTIYYMTEIYDDLIDGSSIEYKKYCDKLNIPNTYSSGEDFCNSYFFDKTNPVSVYSSLDNAYGNAIVLRETLTSQTLSYIQMAQNAMELSCQSSSPLIELQWVIDDIMAFRGSLEDTVDQEDVRNTIKCGVSVEKIDMYLRLNFENDKLKPELQKLLNRLHRTHMTCDSEKLSLLTRCILSGDKIDVSNKQNLIEAIEGLFII